MSNIWILTEERPKRSEIERILSETSKKLGLSMNSGNIFFEPHFLDRIYFNHQFFVRGAKISTIDEIIIRIVSSPSSFVDCLVFHQKDAPDPKQSLKNCLFAIEQTKTNSYDSRNTAMGQRSCKFNFLNQYILQGGYNCKPVMFFTSQQAIKDHDSVLFVNRMLLHLESGIEFWGKESKHLKKFTSLKEFIDEKNRISLTNHRNNDTPLIIKKLANSIQIQALLANPSNTRKNYTGRIGHDPNMGQVPLIAKTIRSLGWEGEIEVIGHQVLQDRISERGNKLTALASKIGFKLQGINLPITNFNPLYWKYEYHREKVASILAQVILENKGHKSIFDNHGGCEKSFFTLPNGTGIAIPKSYSYGGGKIPDLVTLDVSKKVIYSYEGKKVENAESGIEELTAFSHFERDFLQKYYPGFRFERGLVLNGGTNLVEPEFVKFQLLNSGEIIKNSIEFN